MTTYRIVRMYLHYKPSKRAVRNMGGLTLEQAQAHCADPETSSSTCTTYEGRKRTRERGPWFDGYDRE